MNGIERTLVVFSGENSNERLYFAGCDCDCAACYGEPPCQFAETALSKGGYLGGDAKESVTRNEYINPSFVSKNEAVAVLKFALDKGKGVFPLIRELLQRLEDDAL